MSAPHPSSLDSGADARTHAQRPADEKTIQRRNALQVATITLGGAISAFLLYLYLALQSRDRQLFVLVGGAFAFLVSVLVSLALLRRGRLKLGTWLLISATLVAVGGGSLLVTGLGQVAGFAIIFVMPLLVIQMTLPQKESNLAIAASILSGIAVLLLDLFWLSLRLGSGQVPIDRLVMPDVHTAYAFIIVLIIAASAFLVRRQFAGYTLRTKLVVVFLIITIIPLNLLAFINDRVMRSALTGNTNEALLGAALQTAAAIDDFIVNNLISVRTEAQLPDLVGYLELPADKRAGSIEEERVMSILRLLSQKDPEHISSYALLDHQALDVADTFGPDIGTDKSNRDYFQAVSETGQPYVSPVIFSVTAGKVSLYFGSPVWDTTREKIIGALRVRYDAAILQKLIAKNTGLAGEDSAAILLDEYTLRLADGFAPELAFKSIVPLDSTRLNILRSTYRLPPGSSEEFSTDLPDFEQDLASVDTQDPFFTAELHYSGHGLEQAAVARLKTQPWLVVFGQDQAAFLAAATDQQRRNIVLLLAIAGAVAVGALGVTQLLARPIVDLTAVANQIIEGNLDVRADIETSDEIGLLAQTFNTMASQMKDLIASLEERVEARTAQLRAGAEVARVASSTLDPQELLQQTVDLICDQFDYYYAAVFLIDEESAPGEPRYTRLRAGRGEPGRTMLARDHKFEMGEGMVGWVCANKQPRIALDVVAGDGSRAKDAVRFANPLLPETRSEIALPLQVAGRILGALDVQSTQPAAFDESDIAVLQGMADQIAVALENARLFTQTETALAQNEQLLEQIQISLKETTTLYAAGQDIAAAQDQESIFQAIINNVLAPEVDLCMLLLFDPYEERPEDALHPAIGHPTAMPRNLEINQVWTRPGSPPSAQSASAGRFGPKGFQAGAWFEFGEFPFHNCLYADQPGIIQADDEVSPNSAGQVDRVWQHLGMKTIAFIPLKAGARWVGALGLGVSAERPTEYTFDETTLRPYQAMAGQAATALENRRLVESAQESLHELSTLYRTYMREAWTAALQAKPKLAQYDYIRREGAKETSRQADREASSDGRSVLRIPLTVREHEIGLLELESEDRSWSEQERAFVEAISTQAALALDSARLFDQTQRQAGRERLINEITARIRAATSVSDILQTAARELAVAVNVPHALARLRPAETSGHPQDDGSREDEETSRQVGK